MDFQHIQKKVLQCAELNKEKYGVDLNDADFVALKLTEEVGEYIQSLLTYQNKCRPDKCIPKDQAHKEMSAELADVLGMVIVNAHVLNIDLEQAIQKWFYKDEDIPQKLN